MKSVRSATSILIVIGSILVAGVLCAAEAKKSPVKKSVSQKVARTATKKSRSGRVVKAGQVSKSTTAKHSRKSRRSRKASWRRGQQKMDRDRATQVQEALIREHYLSGEPTGIWDQKSQNAMVRFQADNGWQTKVVPDSRALIKLGLGPNHDHLLNPESAMTSPLAPASTDQSPAASALEHSAPTSTPAPPSSSGTLNPVSTPQQ